MFVEHWLEELQTQFEREQTAFGATEEEMEVKIAEILSQLDTATNRTAGAGGVVACGTGGGDAADCAAGGDSTAAQLERESNNSNSNHSTSQFLDVVKIMDLNRECRKRIAQIGEIKGWFGRFTLQCFL